MADPGPLKRQLRPPSSDDPSSKGADVEALKRAISRAGFWEWTEFDEAYSNLFSHGDDDGDRGPGVAGYQRSVGLDGTGTYGENTHEKLRGMKVPAKRWNGSSSSHKGEPVWDEKSASMYRNYRPPEKVPELGPMFAGGKSVLKHDLTHATSGIPLYPAFDDAFDAGVTILAPEDLTITKASSANPGDACYAEGKSGIRYWFGHLVSAPAVGVKIKKGGKVGVTVATSVGGGPHVHVALNVEKLWGTGKQMTHKTSYSHGAPLVGEQLEAGRPL
jgi:hypothetical protein